MRTKRQQNAMLLLCVFPALLVYLLFKLYPTLSGFYYAMTDWNGINKDFSFIGFANYIEIFSDMYFWRSMGFTLKYVLTMVVVSNLIALTLAVTIETRKRSKGLFRTIFFMPNMISMVIGGYMWMFIFTRVLYYMADHWGFSFLNQSWIGDPNFAFIAIVIVSTWSIVGYLMIIYTAALQSVPSALKEAAYLDGANGWQCFCNIVFPMIGHALTICIFWTLNSSFQVFDVVFTLTGGGPGRATQSVALNIYEEAFSGNVRFGYATAKSTVLFAIVLVITLIQLGLMKRKEQEL